MSSNTARHSAIQAITTYKPDAAPLNFADTRPTDIFGSNVFNDRVKLALLRLIDDIRHVLP